MIRKWFMVKSFRSLEPNIYQKGPMGLIRIQRFETRPLRFHTTFPPRMVWVAAPFIFQPSKGVFLLLERSFRGLDGPFRSGSIIVTSAGHSDFQGAAGNAESRGRAGSQPGKAPR